MLVMYSSVDAMPCTCELLILELRWLFVCLVPLDLAVCLRIYTDIE